MKKISLLFITFILVGFSSCNGLDRLTQFDIDYSADFTIPSTIGINLPFNIPVPSITTNISEKLANEQTNTNLVEQLFIKNILLTIKNPSNKSFSFLENIDLYIKTETLPKIKVAYKHDITNEIENILDMDIVENVDLQNYIKEDNFEIEVEVSIDEITLEAIDITADLKFWVDAKF